MIDCVECRTGKPPEPQDDLTFTQIEEDAKRLMSPKYMEEYSKWLNSRPLLVQEKAREFPPYQLYRVNIGAPYRYTVAGSIVSSYSFEEDNRTGRVLVKFRVLRSPIGQAGVIAVIDPKYLTPISLADLKAKLVEEKLNVPDFELAVAWEDGTWEAGHFFRSESEEKAHALFEMLLQENNRPYVKVFTYAVTEPKED